MAGMSGSAFFGALHSTAEMRAVWSARAMVQAWLDAEPALPRAEEDPRANPSSARPSGTRSWTRAATRGSRRASWAASHHPGATGSRAPGYFLTHGPWSVWIHWPLAARSR
jgi:hypothetical protein